MHLLNNLNMTQFEELEKTVAAAKEDAVKFYEKGNALAGKRLRAQMMDVRRLTHAIRDEVQSIKNEKKG